MTTELLDLVDENNHLTGEMAARSEVHARGLWHRTVHIFVFRRVGENIELLVHLRSMEKDAYPGHWDNKFGGHIVSGGSVEGAVKSELKEEVGLSADDFRLVEGAWRKSMRNNEFQKMYFLEYDGDMSDLSMNDGEVEEVKWMALEDIRKAIEKGEEKWTSPLRVFDEVTEHLKDKINLVAK